MPKPVTRVLSVNDCPAVAGSGLVDRQVGFATRHLPFLTGTRQTKILFYAESLKFGIDRCRAVCCVSRIELPASIWISWKGVQSRPSFCATFGYQAVLQTRPDKRSTPFMFKLSCDAAPRLTETNRTHDELRYHCVLIRKARELLAGFCFALFPPARDALKL